MKTAPPKYSDLYNRVVVALDPPTLPKAYIIGIDGRDGAGKSALESDSNLKPNEQVVG
jgi:putative protein kinase ArgK-like GTPase of G3E family